MSEQVCKWCKRPKSAHIQGWGDRLGCFNNSASTTYQPAAPEVGNDQEVPPQPKCKNCGKFKAMHQGWRWCDIPAKPNSFFQPDDEPKPQPVSAEPLCTPNLSPCVVCGKMTEWACADCMIDLRVSVHVCESPECRYNHEARDCSATKSAEKSLPLSMAGAEPEKQDKRPELADDYRPSREHLSNKEVRSTGILCGGAVHSIAFELLNLRAENVRLTQELAGLRESREELVKEVRKATLLEVEGIALSEAHRTTDDESISTCKIISLRIHNLAALANAAKTEGK